jgi:4-methylaminobutanoate oxidase (formaldehyde-forming)
LVLADSHALDTCRNEKAYRHYGHDIASTDHVPEAGLGFAVRTGKTAGRFGHFTGREAVLTRRKSGLSSRSTQFLLADPEPLLFGNEAIVRDGKIAGYITSGGYGHHLGAAVGLGYVKHPIGESAEAVLESRYEIEVATIRVPARASLAPLYDPKGDHMRG